MAITVNEINNGRNEKLYEVTATDIADTDAAIVFTTPFADQPAWPALGHVIAELVPILPAARESEWIVSVPATAAGLTISKVLNAAGSDDADPQVIVRVTLVGSSDRS